MVKANQIPSKFYKLFLLGMAIGLCWTLDAEAQEIRDCDRKNHNQSSLGEDVNYGEMEDDYIPQKTEPTKSRTIVKELKDSPARKISATEKKQESTEEMSTLSFNLFLYIVDRFKED